MQLSTRQRILDVAGDLFHRRGFRAVGVDTIVKASGVAKMTLYRHFRSKDDLVVAYLEEVNRLFWDWLNKAAEPYPEQPRLQLIAIFEALQNLVTTPQCYGCPFLAAAAEFPEPDSPGHAAALAHKQSVRARLCDLARQAGARNPETLADQLLLLLDGAFAAVRMFGPDNPGANVASAATALIDAQGK